MAFSRSITRKMKSWMQSEGRKPLILRGARQTGKTTLVREFGQKFDSFIELNLEKKPTATSSKGSCPSGTFSSPFASKRTLCQGFIGGMPEVVARYATTRDMSQLKPVYEPLITSYKDDVPKYAKTLSEANVIRHVIETAPYETSKRIKFERFGNGNYKSREVGESLKILERAMFLYLRYPVNGHEIPLASNFKMHPRLQFLDTGLLNYALGLTNLYFSGIPLSDAYNGMIAEHIVGQELLAAQNDVLQKPILWVREKKQANAEVDFIIVQDAKVIPVEVKSGSSGTLRSLHSFIDESRLDFALRLYSGPKSIEKTKRPKAASHTR